MYWKKLPEKIIEFSNSTMQIPSSEFEWSLG